MRSVIKRHSWLLVILAFAGGNCLAEETITPDRLRDLMQQKGTVAVNTMSQIECADHRIPGSLCVPCEEIDRFLSKGTPDAAAKIIFYCDRLPCECNPAEIAQKKGYKNVFTLQGGFSAWKAAGLPSESTDRIPRAAIPSVSAEELFALLRAQRSLLIIDIRSEEKYKKAHIDRTVNIPLSSLNRRYPEIPLDRPVVVVDERGDRSHLAASYLERKGFRDIRWLSGGMEKWNEAVKRNRRKGA